MTTFAPLAPTLHVPPTQVAADTWVIPSVQPALGLDEALTACPNAQLVCNWAYDSPTTRGLFDPTTGVYWAVETPLPDPQMGVADLDPEFWDFGLMLFAMGERAFSRIRELPTLDPPEMPDQSVLDQIIAASSEPQS